MSQLQHLTPARVFAYFEEISAIPRGSGNQKAIADYCVDFAKQHGLQYERDAANNVIIRKPAAPDYEQAQTVILQGHLDIVCQKTEQSTICFETDGLTLLTDGDFITADGTTLGADNGIAVAMILAVLEDANLPHPALEAVFTSDEEIGMIGAMQLDMQSLNGKKMINLDAEEDDTLTVSCAGGSDLAMRLPLSRHNANGTLVSVSLKGLKGGHSGMEIDKGSVNADILAGRILSHVNQSIPFDIVSIDGGDKGNAIPNACQIRLCTANAATLAAELTAYAQQVAQEIKEREEHFSIEVTIGENGEYAVFDRQQTEKLLSALLCTPNGVMDMSASIPGLVETSLNLGILKTDDNTVLLHFTLRSNKASALTFLEERMIAFAQQLDFDVECFGHYPPWEYRENSDLQALFIDRYTAQRGTTPKVEAIHAGLECGVFASAIENLDCIAIGPALFDVHTTNERLSISSTAKTFCLLLDILKNCR